MYEYVHACRLYVYIFLVVYIYNIYYILPLTLAIIVTQKLSLNKCSIVYSDGTISVLTDKKEDFEVLDTISVCVFAQSFACDGVCGGHEGRHCRHEVIKASL